MRPVPHQDYTSYLHRIPDHRGGEPCAVRTEEVDHDEAPVRDDTNSTHHGKSGFPLLLESVAIGTVVFILWVSGLVILLWACSLRVEAMSAETVASAISAGQNVAYTKACCTLQEGFVYTAACSRIFAKHSGGRTKRSNVCAEDSSTLPLRQKSATLVTTDENREHHPGRPGVDPSPV